MAIKEGSKLNEIVPGKAVAAIIPSSFDDAVRFGRLFVSAGLYSVAKKGRDQNKSEDEVKEELHAAESQAAVLILYGMELGIPPLQALSGMALINGKPCIYGDLVPAILWSNGFDLEEVVTGEGETLHAVVTVTRPNGKKITREYSAKDAIDAGLWDKRDKIKRKVWKNGSQVWDDVPNDAPWYRQRKRMVQMRARGFACRDGASDVLRGMYLKEEVDVDLDRSEWSEQGEAQPQAASVELPPFEIKQPAPAQIEDRTAQSASEEASLPPIQTHDTREAVEAVIEQRKSGVFEQTATGETQDEKRARIHAQIDADRAEVEARVAKIEPDAPVAEKRGRGRPRKEEAPGTVRATVADEAKPKTDDDLTDAELLADATAKIAVSTDPDELNKLADIQDKRIQALRDTKRIPGLRGQFDIAYNAKYDALEMILNG